MARKDGSPAQSWHERVREPPEEVDARPFSARTGPVAGRWSSLFVVADSLRVESVGDAVVQAEAGPDSPGRHRPPGVAAHAYREGMEVPGGVVVAAEAGAFRLRAEGLRVAEWHEFEVSCVRGACLDGGAGSHARHGAGPASLRVEAYHYVEVRGGGVLEGEGTLFAATAGSARADVAVDGAARLPYATLDGRRVGTVALEGELALGGLQPSGDALQATVSGQYTGARLDETAVEPAALGGWQPAAAAVGVSAAVGLGLALPWLLRLRVRDPATALAHPTRKRILEAAKEHPGTSTHELARISQVPWTTFQHHLAILERVDCVVRHRIGKVWRVYENHGRYGAADRVALATFQNPAVRSLDLWLSRKVRATQSDAVAYAAGSLGIPRATAQTHMERLVGAGRATTWKRRGRRWYETTDPSV